MPSFDASKDEDNGVEVESARGIEHVLKVNINIEVILEPVTILYVPIEGHFIEKNINIL
jgi:hypothetical protein